MSGEALTDEELDERCEKWLADSFNLRIDFDIDEAVDQLVSEDKIVIQDLEVGPSAADLHSDMPSEEHRISSGVMLSWHWLFRSRSNRKFEKRSIS